MKIRMLRVAAPALTILAASTASATEPSHELARTDTTFLLVESGVSLGMLVGGNLFDVPKQCNWCDSNAFDRAGHDALVSGSPRTTAAVSHVLSFGVAPLTAVSAVSIAPLLRDQSSDVAPNTAMLLNVLMVDIAVTSAVKLNVARKRPAWYYGQQQSSEFSDSPNEENLSFFSGDTSVAFSMAAGGSTIAFLRGYSYAPYIAVGSGLAAASSGLLRISSNVHWPTDVLTGALVGTAIGISMPLLLHPRVHESAPLVTASAPLTGIPPQLQLSMVW